jgi:hypothetical protein
LPFLREGLQIMLERWVTLRAFAGEQSKVPWKECARVDERVALAGIRLAKLLNEAMRDR